MIQRTLSCWQRALWSRLCWSLSHSDFSDCKTYVRHARPPAKRSASRVQSARWMQPTGVSELLRPHEGSPVYTWLGDGLIKTGLMCVWMGRTSSPGQTGWCLRRERTRLQCRRCVPWCHLFSNCDLCPCVLRDGLDAGTHSKAHSTASGILFWISYCGTYVMVRKFNLI